MKFDSGFYWLIIILLLVSLSLVIASSRGWFASDQIAIRDNSDQTAEAVASKKSNDSVAAKKSLADSLGIDESEITTIGGIDRPLRDRPTESNGKKFVKNPLPTAGKLPTLRGDENPQVAGLYAELNSPDRPKQAASAMFLPDEFDKEKYFENPQDYLNKIRPGRVFKPAVPANGITPIAASSQRRTTILQGESARLSVKTAEEGYPVTFYVAEGGEFSNRLKTISVAAGEDGVAEAVYTAVSGVSGNIEILASSPLHSGLAKFVVKVVLPEND